MSEKRKNVPTTSDEVVARARELLAEGNARHVIIRDPNDRVLIDTSLTIAAAVTGALVILIPGGLVMAILAVVVAAFARLRIEVVRDLAEDDDIVEMQHLTTEDSRDDDMDSRVSEGKSKLSDDAAE